MKRFFKIVLLLLLVLLIAVALLMVFAPASLVPRALAEAEARNLLDPAAPKLVLKDTSGTVWRGRAADAELLIDNGVLPLGELKWRLKPLSLWHRQPELDITTRAPEHNLQATVNVNEQGVVSARAVEGNMPIKLLEPWVPLLVTGDIAFVVDQLVLNQQRLLALDGVVNLEYIDWLAGDYNMPLGSYMAQLTMQQDNVHMQLNDFSATLGIDGLIVLQPNGQYVFDATLQPRSGLAPEVAQSIGWFGTRKANGDIYINRRGRL